MCDFSNITDYSLLNLSPVMQLEVYHILWGYDPTNFKWCYQVLFHVFIISEVVNFLFSTEVIIAYISSSLTVVLLRDLLMRYFILILSLAGGG